MKKAKKKVDLSGKKLSSLSPNSKGESVGVLNLSNNNFEQVEEIDVIYPNLTVLKMSKNLLAVVPRNICYIDTLTKINFSQNELRVIPADIFKLVNLKRLDVSHNRLSSFPPTFAALAALTELDISYNFFSVIPASLGQLSKTLIKLDVTENPLVAPYYPLTRKNINIELKTIFEHMADLKKLPYDITHTTTIENYNDFLERVPMKETFEDYVKPRYLRLGLSFSAYQEQHIPPYMEDRYKFIQFANISTILDPTEVFPEIQPMLWKDKEKMKKLDRLKRDKELAGQRSAAEDERRENLDQRAPCLDCLPVSDGKIHKAELETGLLFPESWWHYQLVRSSLPVILDSRTFPPHALRDMDSSPSVMLEIRDANAEAERITTGTAGVDPPKLKPARIWKRKQLPQWEPKEDEVIPKLEGTLSEDDKIAFIGVYDGHGGGQASDYLENNFHLYLFNQKNALRNKEYQRALYNAVVQCDENFLYHSRRRKFNAGSTLVGCLLVNNILTVANVGDSRAVLCRAGETISLTSDQTPVRPDEAARVVAAGGFVELVNDAQRVMGKLMMSRSMGDLKLKEPIPAVIAEPEISQVVLGPDDMFLLVASDGLFDVYTNEEAVEFILTVPNRWTAAEELMSEAKKATGDNLTCVVIWLNWDYDCYEATGGRRPFNTYLGAPKKFTGLSQAQVPDLSEDTSDDIPSSSLYAQDGRGATPVRRRSEDPKTEKMNSRRSRKVEQISSKRGSILEDGEVVEGGERSNDTESASLDVVPALAAVSTASQKSKKERGSRGGKGKRRQRASDGSESSAAEATVSSS